MNVMSKSLIWSVLSLVVAARLMYGIVVAVFSEGGPFGPEKPSSAVEAEAEANDAGNLPDVIFS